MSLRIFIVKKAYTKVDYLVEKNNVDYYLDFGGNCAKILATNSLISFSFVHGFELDTYTLTFPH
jgi:hypothetical protein